MATYELFFSNGQLGDFNSNGFQGGFFGSQVLTANSNHPGDRLVDSGAVTALSDVTGWRLTVEGDEEPGDNDVVPGASMTVEYSTDGGATWISYADSIGSPGLVFFARQDEEGWMAITANDPSQPDSQLGFIVADDGVTPGQDFITDETIIETQVGEYALPCFTDNTLISTREGRVSLSELKVGDSVLTVDNGYQVTRWIGKRHLDSKALSQNPQFRPVRIHQGALGHGQPEQDLLVSRQHRILVRSHIAQRMFGTSEILVAGHLLVGLEGVEVASDVQEVTYVHILFDRHEVVFANGAETESLFTGPEALKSISAAAREEIFFLFPELKSSDYTPIPARLVPKGARIRQMVARHMKNGKPLIAA